MVTQAGSRPDREQVKQRTEYWLARYRGLHTARSVHSAPFRNAPGGRGAAVRQDGQHAVEAALGRLRSPCLACMPGWASTAFIEELVETQAAWPSRCGLASLSGAATRAAQCGGRLARVYAQRRGLGLCCSLLELKLRTAARNVVFVRFVVDAARSGNVWLPVLNLPYNWLAAVVFLPLQLVACAHGAGERDVLFHFLGLRRSHPGAGQMRSRRRSSSCR